MPTHIPIVVAYKAPRKRKVSLKIFTDLRCPDKLITKRSTLIPSGSEILDIGIGEKFKETYKKKYKL